MNAHYSDGNNSTTRRNWPTSSSVSTISIATGNVLIVGCNAPAIDPFAFLRTVDAL